MSKDKKPKNPVKDEKVSDRVSRGGGWYYDARYARLPFRNLGVHSSRYHDLGFRIVKNIPKDPKEKKNE